MKKIILLFALVYLVSLAAISQSIEISFDGSVIPNGGTITPTDTSSQVSFAINLGVKNKSTNSIPIRVKKKDLYLVSGTENSFCWGQCEPPGVDTSSSVITLAAGVSDKNSFVGDYSALGFAGKSRVMFTFFVDNNPNDSTSIIIEYNAGSAVGFFKPIASVDNFQAFPNPAKSMVNINYNGSNLVNAKIEIRSIIGTLAKTITVNAQSGEFKFDVSDLNNGVYFYSLLINDKTLISKKLIIQK